MRPTRRAANDNRAWTDAQVEQARDYLAECVVRFGEAYVRFFQIVEDEIARRRTNTSALERAREIVRQKRAA